MENAVYSMLLNVRISYELLTLYTMSQTVCTNVYGYWWSIAIRVLIVHHNFSTAVYTLYHTLMFRLLHSRLAYFTYYIVRHLSPIGLLYSKALM